MTSKLTREQLRARTISKVKNLKKAISQSAFTGIKRGLEEELQIAEFALAAMDSEPVATLDVQSGRSDGNKFALVFSSAAHKLPDDVYFLYRHAQQPVAYNDFEEFWSAYIHPLAQDDEMKGFAWDIWSAGVSNSQPAPDREQVRREHAEWSQATFGDVGPIGPLKHLSKEALEAAAEPGDLSEWADMQFLLWDAQRRAGITDEQITQAMIEKLAVNKQREWPEPKDGQPRLHIKEQPVPVVPEDIPDSVYEILCQACGGKAWMYEEALWNACRAAMLQAGSDEIGSWSNSKNTPTSTAITPAAPDKKLTDDVLDEIIAGAKTSMEQYLALSLKAEREVWRKEGPTDDERIMAIEGIHNCERCGDEGWVVGEMGITRCSCSQAGNSPVIPDGLIAAVNRLLDSDGSRGCYSAIRCYDAREEVERLLAAAPQEVQGE